MSAPETTTTPAAAPVEAPVVADKPEETTAAPVTEEAAAPAAETAAAEAPVTETAATEAPATDAAATEAPATEAAATETTTEPAAASAEPAKAIESGVLGYKAPGLIKSFKFSKKHFWLGDEAPVSTEKLSNYLRGEKPEIAHPTAAWSSQTGKGLLYFAKHAEEKATPAGVLNLAEASDLEKSSPHEFSFKLHGHKHTFKAADDAERDGWYVAIEKAIAEAKASKDAVVTSEGYKEALALVAKPAVVVGGAAAAVTAARKSTEAPKIEEPARAGSTSSTSDEEAAKKKKESRSVSRGKRASIFGSFLNKKEDHEAKKEVKKEEKEEAKAEKKEEEEAEAKAEEPAVEAVEPAAAPADAEAAAAPAAAAPVEEAAVAEPAVATETAPAAEASKEEAARPKPNKRSSIFGSFFEKVRSPTHEKKESEVAPTVPPKDTIVSAEPPVIPEPSTTETTIESPAAPVAAETAAPAAEESTPKAEPASPKKEKESFFGGIVNKVRAKSPAPVTKSEEAPAVPPKTEEPAAAPAAEETTPAATEAPAAAEPATETPRESRRKSYFGGQKISSIFRKPSQAIRGSKKENEAPAAAATEDKAVTPTETPAVAEEAAPAVETKTEEPQAVSDVVPEAVAVGQEHKSSPVVSAAA